METHFDSFFIISFQSLSGFIYKFATAIRLSCLSISIDRSLRIIIQKEGRNTPEIESKEVREIEQEETSLFVFNEEEFARLKVTVTVAIV